MPDPEISIIATFNTEGTLCIPLLRSIAQAREQARHEGLATELCLVLDNADQVTRSAVHANCPRDALIIDAALGCASLARNLGIKSASGNAAALVDGDDVWPSNWLVRGYRELVLKEPNTIVHPKFIYFFGDRSELFIQLDQPPDVDDALDRLRFMNLWDTSAIAWRNAYLETPFPLMNERYGWMVEDWDWNIATITAGYRHEVVSDLILFKRVRSGSLSMRLTDRESHHPRPTQAFAWRT